MRRVALVPLMVLLSCAPATDARAPAPAPSASAASPSAASAHDASASAASPSAARTNAPVVVTIVVDQLAAWIAAERWPLLPDDGGFARLRREGTYAKEMRYAHAATDTAPGHAALYTGGAPRVSGIFGNEVIDPKSDARISILQDGATQVVGSDGVTTQIGASAAALASPTLADALRAAHPDAIIVSLSLKDRGAIMGGGAHPTASIWYDRGAGRFVTSTAFARALPSWAAASPLPREAWTLLDAPWVKAHAATPDAQPGEGGLGGMGVVFPHAMTGIEAPANAFRATPFADEALLTMALAALDARRPEAAREHPTLLALSLSANDYVGHSFGPDSWEAWDELRRLDASLARFFAGLDARFGADGWAAVLAADHGVTTMPEAAAIARPWCASKDADRWQRACGPVGRLMPDALTKELRAAAASALGAGSWVLGVADPWVFFTPEAEALEDARRGKLVAMLTKALTAHREVDRVIDTRSLAPSCPPEDVRDLAIDPLLCRAFAKGAGALYVLPKRGSFFDPSVVVGKGTSHGTPYLFDRAVPLLARGAHIPAGAVIDEPISFRTFARTAAALLAVPPPPAAQDARSLVVSP